MNPCGASFRDLFEHLIPGMRSFSASSTSAPRLAQGPVTGSKESTMTVAVCDTSFSSGPEYSRNGPPMPTRDRCKGIA
jgi:hypothetical protein